jgi:hypothetical protein
MPDSTPYTNRRAFCSAGLLPHRWKRVVSRDRSGDLRCPSCKSVYDPSVFDEPLTHCPRDGKELEPARTWRRQCEDCEVTA